MINEVEQMAAEMVTMIDRLIEEGTRVKIPRRDDGSVSWIKYHSGQRKFFSYIRFRNNDDPRRSLYKYMNVRNYLYSTKADDVSEDDFDKAIVLFLEKTAENKKLRLGYK